jgi:hypothetical protein
MKTSRPVSVPSAFRETITGSKDTGTDKYHGIISLSQKDIDIIPVSYSPESGETSPESIHTIPECTDEGRL